jgi:Skp family chaperone for outer membrane proteins
MDIDNLIGEVAKKFGVLYTKNDPVLTAAYVNERVLGEHIDRLERLLAKAQERLVEEARRQEDRLLAFGNQVMEEASVAAAQQVRSATEDFKNQIENGVLQALGTAVEAAAESKKSSHASELAAVASILGVLTILGGCALAWQRTH